MTKKIGFYSLNDSGTLLLCWGHMKTSDLKFPILDTWTCIDTKDPVSMNGVLYQHNDLYYLKVKTKDSMILRADDAIGGLRWFIKLSSEYFLELLVNERSSSHKGNTSEWVFIVDVISLTKGKPSKFQFNEFWIKTTNVKVYDKKLIWDPVIPKKENYNLLMSSSAERDYFTFGIEVNDKSNFVDFWYGLDYIKSLYVFHYSFPVEFALDRCKTKDSSSEIFFSRYRPNPVSNHQQPIKLEDLFNFTLSHFHTWNDLRSNKVFVDVIYSLKSAILEIERKGGLDKFMVLPIQQAYEGLATALKLPLPINQEINKDHVKAIKEEIVKKSKELLLSDFATDRLKNALNFVLGGSAHDKIFAIMIYIPKEKLIKNLKTTDSELESATKKFIKEFKDQRNYLNHYGEEFWTLENIVDYYPLISILFDFINTYTDNQVDLQKAL